MSCRQHRYRRQLIWVPLVPGPNGLDGSYSLDNGHDHVSGRRNDGVESQKGICWSCEPCPSQSRALSEEVHALDRNRRPSIPRSWLGKAGRMVEIGLRIIRFLAACQRQGRPVTGELLWGRTIPVYCVQSPPLADDSSASRRAPVPERSLQGSFF